MTTVFTHPVVAVGLFPWFREAGITKMVVVIGAIFTVLPDVDVIGLKMGIPYGHVLGHRGITHSILFALAISLFTGFLIKKSHQKHFFSISLYLFLCMISHGILDAFTNGGLGIAFFSPFSNERIFFSVNIIEVSTLSPVTFFQGQGVSVINSEIRYVWLPACLVFLLGYTFKKIFNKAIKPKK